MSLSFHFKNSLFINNQVPDVTVLIPSFLIRQQRDIQEPDPIVPLFICG
jgi:hypothetical protein